MYRHNQEDERYQKAMQYARSENRKVMYWLIGIGAFVVFALVIDKAQKESPITAKNQSPDEIRKKRIERQFSGWNGCHYNLEKYVKDNMNDPDSYQHIETRYSDEGEYLLVATKFRGNNAFGGKVINYITAKVSLHGKILEIIEK
jgi:hypothetical protein